MGAGCGDPAKSMKTNFILVDRRWHLAKIISDDNQALLLTFFRSLHSPGDDGLVIADSRTSTEIRDAFRNASAELVPPTPHSLCATVIEGTTIMKFSIHPKPKCSGAGWRGIKNGYFRAYRRPRRGLYPVTYCEGPKYWTQHIVKGEACDLKWANLQWLEGHTFYAPPGNSFCFGTRMIPAINGSIESFSRVQPGEYCGVEGFKHEYSFSSVKDYIKPRSVTVCILRSTSSSATRVELAPNCEKHKMKLMARFAARSEPDAHPSDLSICVRSGPDGDSLHTDFDCRGQVKLEFRIPRNRVTSTGSSDQASLQICTGYKEAAAPSLQKKNYVIGVGAECNELKTLLKFNAPSVADVAASIWRSDGSAGGDSWLPPLFNLIDEETPCFSFLCPDALKNAMFLGSA